MLGGNWTLKHSELSQCRLHLSLAAFIAFGVVYIISGGIISEIDVYMYSAQG